MTSTSGVSNRPSTRPLSQTEQPKTTDVAPRPGYDFFGRPLKDQDVWGGIKTPEGKTVNTADGIDDAELATLVELLKKDVQQFVHRMGADSKNGTPVTVHREQNISEGISNFATFSARDGKVLIEAGIEIKQNVARDWVGEYLAPDAEQPTAPIRAKVTLTGEINRKGEIKSLTMVADAVNLPRFSLGKLTNYERAMEDAMRFLKVGQPITEGTQRVIKYIVASYVLRASSQGVELGKNVILRTPAVKLVLSQDDAATEARLKAGKGVLGIQIDHVLDVLQKGNARIDGSTEMKVAENRDTLDLGKLEVHSTEKLVVAFKDNKPELYRIEADGSRTKLNDIFGELLVHLPFLLGQR